MYTIHKYTTFGKVVREGLFSHGAQAGRASGKTAETPELLRALLRSNRL
jgi:hypothetical protein